MLFELILDHEAKNYTRFFKSFAPTKIRIVEAKVDSTSLVSYTRFMTQNCY